MYRLAPLTVTVNALIENQRPSIRPKRYSRTFDWSDVDSCGNRTQVLTELRKIITQEFKTETRHEAATFIKKAKRLNQVARELEFQSEELKVRAGEQNRAVRQDAQFMSDQIEKQVEHLREQANAIRSQADEQSVVIRQQAEEIKQFSEKDYHHMMKMAITIAQQGRKQVEIVRKQAGQLRVNLRDQIEMMKLQSETQASQMELQAEQLKEQAAIFRLQSLKYSEPGLNSFFFHCYFLFKRVSQVYVYKKNISFYITRDS